MGGQERIMSTIRLRAALMGFGLVLCGPAMAQAPAAPRTPGEAQVLELENRLLQARVTGDLSAIRTGFAADGVYIQDNGDILTRDAYLKAAARAGRWLAVHETEALVRVYGDAAVTHAVVVVKVSAERTERERTTVVYARQGGRWRVVSWQQTPAVPAP
jgi:hypothetical protein